MTGSKHAQKEAKLPILINNKGLSKSQLNQALLDIVGLRCKTENLEIANYLVLARSDIDV